MCRLFLPLLIVIAGLGVVPAWADTDDSRSDSALPGQMAWLARASALEKHADWPGLLAWGTQWVRVEPENATAWFVLGRAYSKVGRYPEAIAAYRQNLKIDASDVAALINLGNLYRAGNHLPQALTAYREALQRDPDYIQAWHNLGQTLFAMKGMVGVTAALRQLNAHEPELAAAWRELIVEYAVSRDQRVAQKAIKVLRGLDADKRRRMFDILLAGV